MQNNVNTNISWYEWHNYQRLGQKIKILKILCTKYMASSEAMTSSTHSFAYSYGLVKKCFLKICETSKFHNFLIFQPIFIRFSLFCSENFTLSSEIKLDQLRTSPLTTSSVCMPARTRTHTSEWLINSNCIQMTRIYIEFVSCHFHLFCHKWMLENYMLMRNIDNSMIMLRAKPAIDYYNIYTLQKATRLWLIMFLLSWIYIHQVRLLGLFH